MLQVRWQLNWWWAGVLACASLLACSGSPPLTTPAVSEADSPLPLTRCRPLGGFGSSLGSEMGSAIPGGLSSAPGRRCVHTDAGVDEDRAHRSLLLGVRRQNDGGIGSPVRIGISERTSEGRTSVLDVLASGGDRVVDEDRVRRELTTVGPLRL